MFLNSNADPIYKRVMELNKDRQKFGAIEVMIEKMEDQNVPMQMMLLDATFTDAPASKRSTPPSVLLYGLNMKGESIAVHVNDFLPYFWFPAPTCKEDGKEVPLGEDSLEIVKEHLIRSMQTIRKRSGGSSDNFVAGLSLEKRTPLMYYRQGGPFLFLKVEVWRGKDVAAVAKELTVLAENNDLRGHGLIWKDQTSHEDGIKLGMRFFCDTALAGGSWMEIKHSKQVPHSEQTTRCSKELEASWHNLTGLTPDATHHMEFTEAVEGVPAVACNNSGISSQQSREIILGMDDETDLSLGDEEGLVDFSEIQSKLSTQEQSASRKQKVVDSSVSEPSTSTSTSEESTWSLIAPLRIVSLHVQCSGGGKVSSSETIASSSISTLKSSGRGRGRGKGRAAPPVSANPKGRTRGGVTLETSSVDESKVGDIEALGNLVGGGSPIPSRDPVLLISNILCFRGHEDGTRQVVFTHGKSIQEGNIPGVEVREFTSENTMLLAWQDFFFWEVDPDVVCVYQMKESLRYMAERFKVLKLGTFGIGRRKGQSTEVKSVVTYGKHWVRQQARMTSTSNQEVFRAYVEGRMVIDMLRVILVSFNLSTFTLGECCQLFLGTPKEVISTAVVSELWNGKHGGLQRLIHYSLHEAEVALKLMEKLQTVPETVEMARVTGLTLSEVLYKAQMVRVQSLLLRSARREGWLLGGTTLNGQLSESPFLLHPKDNHTAGIYQDPIAILDFASLYPSLFMAHNLCYTTLVHPEDVSSLPADQLMTRMALWVGVVQAQLVRNLWSHHCDEVYYHESAYVTGALITARKQARDCMANDYISPEERAVLDGRQKALKLCSNALYGFTGASASPQQALPLADTCLSMGAASCQQAVQLVGNMFETAKVIYAQTDSVFVHFQGASIDEAIKLGTQAAEIVSQAFPSPMALKFERVLCPFLLLQVNRYAGKQYTSSQALGPGTLFVKGIEAERRDVPGFVRHICKQALYDILVDNDIARALENCKNFIRRLVAGKWSLSEMVMTGGLWRVDDHDIAKLAAVTKSPRKQTGASTAEEGRGPHVALSVRLKRKDPDRQFHIGERISYILMANSSKLQDDMAEDPLDALMGGIPVNTHVYLENKLRKPLESILEYVTDSATLRELFTGSHTVPPPSTSLGASNCTQALVSNFFRPKASCLNCRKPMEVDTAALCQDCTQGGYSQSAVTEVFLEISEQERKLAGATAQCMRCHSGGHFEPVLCTNSDCHVLYMRYECPQSLRHTESALTKLDNQF